MAHTAPHITTLRQVATLGPDSTQRQQRAASDAATGFSTRTPSRTELRNSTHERRRAPFAVEREWLEPTARALALAASIRYQPEVEPNVGCQVTHGCAGRAECQATEC